MTPQLTIVPMTTRGTHLTEEQFGELIAGASANPAAAAHILTCQQCAAELDQLRESLSLFRQASTLHAAGELRRMALAPVPWRGILSPATQRAWLATAAAVAFLVALLPVHQQRRASMQHSSAVAADAPGLSAESDEALLDDVDRDVSASVPAPMQALADPGAVNLTNSALNASDQRKD